MKRRSAAMLEPDRASRQERVLVLAPTAKDARLCQSILDGAGIVCAACPDLATMCQELGMGAGAVVVTEEALNPNGLMRLAEALGRQPPWSDLPVLVLAREGA